MSEIERAAKWIEESNYITFELGAGASVASGIPTFRGPMGLYYMVGKWSAFLFALVYWLAIRVHWGWITLIPVFLLVLLFAVNKNDAAWLVKTLGQWFCALITQPTSLLITFVLATYYPVSWISLIVAGCLCCFIVLCAVGLMASLTLGRLDGPMGVFNFLLTSGTNTVLGHIRWWVLKLMVWDNCASANPNRGHLAIACLQKLFPEKYICVKTMNVDNLERVAGCVNVRQKHGQYQLFQCPIQICGPAQVCTRKRLPWIPFRCTQCGRVMRTGMLLFSDPDNFVYHLANHDDSETPVPTMKKKSLVIAIGMSGVIGRSAWDSDRLIELNMEATGVFSRPDDYLYIRGEQDRTMEAIVRAVKNK